MTLLEDWQQKSTWQNCFSPVPLYQSRSTGFVDLSFREVLRREKSWTYDEKEPTGFSEIGLVPAIFPGVKFAEPVEMADTIEGICHTLLSILRETLTTLWNPRIPHIFYASGGRDSRILLNVLWNLMKDGFDVGELTIICHEPEQNEFKAAMSEMAMPQQYWHIRKEDALTQPDYYDVPPISRDCNGFVGPQITLFQPDVSTKDTCLVTGSFGGELVDYPVYRKRRITFGQFMQFAVFPWTYLCEYYMNWKDILMPYMSFNYMNYIFHIPQKFFVATGDVSLNGGDLLRDTMLKQLGNTTPFYYRHKYNTQLSIETQSRIQGEYLQSNFVRYFQTYKEFLTIRPAINIFNKWNMGSKLYGLATVFEGLPESKVEQIEIQQTQWTFEHDRLLIEWREAERLNRVERFHKHDLKYPPTDQKFGDLSL